MIIDDWNARIRDNHHIGLGCKGFYGEQFINRNGLKMTAFFSTKDLLLRNAFWDQVMKKNILLMLRKEKLGSS